MFRKNTLQSRGHLTLYAIFWAVLSVALMVVDHREKEVQQLVENQRAYFRSNATRSAEFRLTQLRKLKTLLLANEEQMHQAIFKDFGKSKYENQLTEFFPLIDEINMSIKNLKKWMQHKPVKTNLLNFPAKSYLVPEPLGVTLVIGAWNSYGPV